VIASFIIGIALFFEVGLVLLIPIIYAISKELKVPFLYLGIPMAAALNVTHGFFPPHPAPTAISIAYALFGQVCIFITSTRMSKSVLVSLIMFISCLYIGDIILICFYLKYKKVSEDSEDLQR
jgi:GntP family gluconate:H+ symporter